MAADREARVSKVLLVHHRRADMEQADRAADGEHLHKVTVALIVEESRRTGDQGLKPIGDGRPGVRFGESVEWAGRFRDSA